MRALYIILPILCVLAIAYRYYSAFIAARIMSLDDSRRTPAHVRNDGHNYHPTHRLVLFGHHFAAITGAGPLIGPVLAAQFGYAPGLIWLVARLPYRVLLAIGRVMGWLAARLIGPDRRGTARRNIAICVPAATKPSSACNSTGRSSAGSSPAPSSSPVSSYKSTGSRPTPQRYTGAVLLPSTGGATVRS